MLFILNCSVSDRYLDATSLSAAALLFLILLSLVCLLLGRTTQLDGIASGRWLLASRREFILVDLVDHLHERLLHIDISTGARLEVLHVIVSGELFSLLSRDCALLRQITLVAYEQCCDVSLAILIDGHDPASNRLERLWLGQIETDHHALRLLVERHCE